MAAPVIWLAASEQRNTAICPTCPGSTNSSDGCFSASNARAPSSIETPRPSARASICRSMSSVRTQPGQIALQVIG